MQRVQGWDKRYQYLLFAAEPYEIIAFKVSVSKFVMAKLKGDDFLLFLLSIFWVTFSCHELIKGFILNLVKGGYAVAIAKLKG
jgi:hypothetical protein